MTLVAVTAGRFEALSSRFGESVGAAGGRQETGAVVLGPRGRVGAAANADPVAAEQAHLVSAQGFQGVGDDPNTSDADAISNYQQAASFAAVAADSVASRDSGSSAVSQFAQAADAASASAQAVSDRLAAQGFAEAAILAAQQAITQARADLTPNVQPPPPNPNPGPQPNNTSTAGTNWTPWLIAGISLVAVATAGFFLYRFLKDEGKLPKFLGGGARENPMKRLGAGSASKSTSVQTLVFSKTDFRTAKMAKRWARDHGFRFGKVDETSTSFRVRQESPSRFKKDSFRTKRFRRGVSAVIARRK